MTWPNTTHDWATSVDADHLADIRRRPQELAPGGGLHLLLDVIAYAADEAAVRGAGSCRVTLHADGSLAVTDDGRGTDTLLDEHGQAVKKPVMSTQDLRFFDASDGPLLPDGHARRGMSVVAALSEWLVHRNRRHTGAWTQRYESKACRSPTCCPLKPTARPGPRSTSCPRRPCGRRLRPCPAASSRC
jgi:DNA gyrase subunit B